jgi:hypothetical protein
VRQNTGHMPADAKGKRIRGVLRNGMRFGFGSLAEEGSPPGWPADSTRWSIEPAHPFDIVEWELIG